MLRHVPRAGYRGLVIRRLYPDLMQPGGIWQTIRGMASQMQGEARESPPPEIKWGNSAALYFRHMQHEKDAERLRGSQYDRAHMEECDELSEGMFWAIVQTLRSGPAGIAPRLRGNLNPVPSEDHWIARLVKPYLTPDDYPDPEQSGVVRYFKRAEDNGIEWTDADDPLGMSFTFIPSKLSDNKILSERDPQYQRNLENLPSWERERMLGGRWFQAPTTGLYSRSQFRMLDAEPGGVRWYRYWDHAATEPSPKNPDPDWTVGIKAGVHDGRLVIAHMEAFRAGPAEKRQRMQSIAEQDGEGVTIILEREPAASGKESFHDYQTRILRGFRVLEDKATGARGGKVDRAGRWLAWLEQGNVAVVNGAWNRQLFEWVEQFPNGKMDAIDAISGVFAASTRGVGLGSVQSGSAGLRPSQVRGARPLRFSGGIA